LKNIKTQNKCLLTHYLGSKGRGRSQSRLARGCILRTASPASAHVVPASQDWNNPTSSEIYSPLVFILRPEGNFTMGSHAQCKIVQVKHIYLKTLATIWNRRLIGFHLHCVK